MIVIANHIQFQYKHTLGDRWASGFIGTDKKKFEFFCSYLLNNPLEELLTAIYQIIPNLAPYSRKEINFTMLDEPIEYRWTFKLIDEKNVTLHIYEQEYNLKKKLIFEDKYSLDNLLKALIQCIGSNPELRLNEKIEHIYKEFNFHLKFPSNK